MMFVDVCDGDVVFEVNRVVGNVVYDCEVFVEVMVCYMECVEVLEKCFGLVEGEGMVWCVCVICVNCVVCFVKCGKYVFVMEDVLWVIVWLFEVGVGIFVKALYRRARAREGVGDVEVVLVDLWVVEKIDLYDVLI